MDPPFLAEYESNYREKPKITIFADEDEAFAKMRAGFTPDVMGPCYYEFPRWQEAGLLQPIDTTKLKNWNKISPTLRNLPGISAGPNKVWFVPHYWGNTSITFRTDLAPEYVKHPELEHPVRSQIQGPRRGARRRRRHRAVHRAHDRHRRLSHDAGAMGAGAGQAARARASRRASSPATTRALAQGLASGEIVAAMSWRIVYSTLHARRKARRVS